MEYSKLTTDELVNFIVTKIGIPIPKYNYEKRKFETLIPLNIKNGNNVTGIEDEMFHNNFRNACFKIVMWWDEFNCA